MAASGESARAWRQVRSRLEKLGLLLLSDPRLESVTTLVAGEPVRGSWWAHPAAHAIYAVANRLEADPDSSAVKLVAGKVTFVHRALWTALLGVATEQADWQLRSLSAPARRLLALVERQGEVCLSDQSLPPDSRRSAQALEKRLLTFSEQLHTERGKHERRLLSWDTWCRREGVDLEAGLDPAEARRRLETAAARLSKDAALTAALPWKPS